MTYAFELDAQLISRKSREAENQTRPHRLDRIVRQRRNVEPCLLQSPRPRSVVASLRQIPDDVHAAIDVLEGQPHIRAREQLDTQRGSLRALAAPAPHGG